MPIPTQYTRREALAICATVLGGSSAGCTQGSSKGATDVVVRNESNGAKSASVSITGATDEQPRLETTVSLDTGERTTPTASDKLPIGGDYTVEIDVEEGPTETYHWPDVSLELAPLHVILGCDAEIYFELQSESSPS